MKSTTKLLLVSAALTSVAALAVPLAVTYDKTLDGDQIAAIAATLDMLPGLAVDPDRAVAECLASPKKRTISVYPREKVVMVLLHPASDCWGPTTRKLDGDILLIFERGSARHLETVRDFTISARLRTK